MIARNLAVGRQVLFIRGVGRPKRYTISAIDTDTVTFQETGTQNILTGDFNKAEKLFTLPLKPCPEERVARINEGSDLT